MKNLPSYSSLAVFAAALTGSSLLAGAQEKVTYNDHVLPIFKNACLNCHNPDKKKAGLDLSTYQGALAGSDNGKVMQSGNSANSLLIKCIKQTEEPKMPPKGDKLTDPEIAVLEKWIAGQLLETATGKAVVASNNVSVAVVSLSRPDGPAPMPLADLPLEPFVRTKTTNALVALAASPWAPLVAVGGQRQIILYNTETLQPLGILPFPEGFPAIIRFSKNGKLLLTGGGLGGKSGEVVLWDVQTGERVGVVGNEFDQVLAADLSPDQQHVALGGPGKILKIYATKDGKQEQSIKKHTDWITAIAYSPDGKYLASADRNGGISVWEGSTGREFNNLPGHKASVTALSFMPGVLASSSEDGKISLWDVKEGKEIRSWTAHGGGASSVDFTTDGRLVSAGRDKLAKAWDQNGKALLTSAPFTDIALRAVLADDRVIAGDWNGNIRVFSLKENGKAVGELTLNPLPIADNLAAAEKDLAEAKTAIATNQQALATAEKNLKDAQQAAVQKKKDEVAAAEKAVQQAKDEVAAVKAAPAKIETELKAARAQVEATAKALSLLPEADRPAQQPKVDGEKKAVADLEAKLAAADADARAKTPAAEKKQQDATAALAKAQAQEVKLPPAPAALAKVKDREANVETIKAEIARLKAKRPTTSGGDAMKALNGRIEGKQAEIAPAEAALEAAKQVMNVPAEISELQRVKGELEKAEGRIAGATSTVQRWQRAKAFMTVHNAKQSVADLQARYDGLVATAKDALSPIDRTAADIADAEKTLQAAPANVAAKEKIFNEAQAAAKQATAAAEAASTEVADKETKRKAAAELTTKLETDLANVTKRQMTAKAAFERREKLLEGVEKDTPKFESRTAAVAAVVKENDESTTALSAAKKAFDENAKEVQMLTEGSAKGKEHATATALAAKKANAAATAAESALTAARKAKETAGKTISDLKPKTGEIAETAKKAKADAEKEAAAVAKQLETAKAEATRIRGEYQAKYPAPPAAQPIAAK